MGKNKENPRCNVLSLRVSDQELEALANQLHDTDKNISDLMREALHTIVPPAVGCTIAS